MALLTIDAGSNAWRAVQVYAVQRMSELTEQCVSITATDDQRREAAYRIAELRELMDAPNEAQKVGRMKTDEARGTY